MSNDELRRQMELENLNERILELELKIDEVETENAGLIRIIRMIARRD